MRREVSFGSNYQEVKKIGVLKNFDSTVFIKYTNHTDNFQIIFSVSVVCVCVMCMCMCMSIFIINSDWFSMHWANDISRKY